MVSKTLGLERAFVALLFVVAAFAPSALAGEGPGGDAGADVFFIVDNSGSMKRIDPEGLRIDYARALADLLFSRPGDRVSVVRLGGRLESARYETVVLPLVKVPDDPSERASFLAQSVKDALAREAKGFGRGSDFNAAFEEGVFKQLALREAGSRRPVVIVVVSDGNMEVIEGDEAPEIYLNAADEMDGRTLRDRVNAAAMEMFRTQTLPVLSNRFFNTYVVPVVVGGMEEEGRYVLKDLAGVPGAGRIVDLSGSLLDALARSVRLSGQDPDAPWNELTLAVFDDIAVEAQGGEASVDVRIPLEAERTRLLVLGPHAEFTTGLSGPGNAMLGEAEGVRIYGRLDRHRVIDVSRRDIPNHKLHVINQADQPASFQAAVLCSFRLEGELALGNEDGALRGGETVRLKMGVIDAARREPVTDPWLLDKIVAVARLTDASGEAVEKRFPFAGSDSGRQIREIPLDPRTPAGTFVARVFFRLEGDGSEALLTIPAVEATMPVLRGVPTVQVGFVSGKAFQGHEVGLTGRMTSGNPPARTIDVVLEGPVSGEGDKAHRAVTLAWDPEAMLYRGRTTFDAKGRWEVQEERAGEDRKIVKSVAGGLEVISRGVVLLDEKGAKILESVTFSPRSTGEGASYPPLTFLVSGDLLPGEKGVLELEATAHGSAGGASMVFEGTRTLELTAEEPRARVTLRLDAEKTMRLEGRLGTIEIRGTLGGDPVHRRAPVSAAPLPGTEEEWTRLLEKKEVLIAGGAVLGAILIGLLLLVTIPKYRQQHLLHEREDGGWDEGALLAEFQTGRNPRNAYGTAEIKNAVWFRLRGRRGLGGGKTWARPLKPFIQFYKNDEIQNGWTRLNHGDRIRLRGARYQEFYRFLERPLSADEYDALQPERPAHAEAVDVGEAAPRPEEETGQAELVIELPGEEEAEAAPAMAEHGFVEEGSEPPTAVEEAGGADLSELDTIFGEKPPAPAPEEMQTAGEGDKALSFTDIFGEEETVPPGETPEAEEGGQPGEGEGPTFDDQETIFEQFFGGDSAGAEETEAPAEAGDGTEIVGAETAPGDGTEIVDEKAMEEAFEFDPEGIFSDADLAKIMEEAGGDDDSLVIDMPLDFEEAQEGEQDVFTVGSEDGAAGEEGEDADAADEAINPELVETQEVVKDEQDLSPELFSTEEGESVVEAEEEEMEIEAEEGEGEGEMQEVEESEEGGEDEGIFSGMLAGGEEEEGQGLFSDLSEIRSEMDEHDAFEAGEEEEDGDERDDQDAS